MIITNIEVISRNAQVSPGEKLQLDYGNTLRIYIGLEYRGTGRNVTLYGVIGKRQAVIGFDEIVHDEADLSLPDTPGGFLPVEGSVDILITEDLDPGLYDIYCKILEHPEAELPEVADAIEVVGLPSTFTLIQETLYSYAYVYDGDAETTTTFLRCDPFIPVKWQAAKLADNIRAELMKNGRRILELRVYADTSPLLWSDFKIEVTLIPLPETTGSLRTGYAVPLVVTIVIAALAIIGVIVAITLSVKSITKTFQHKPISEKIKATWSRETLISAIHDFEEMLDRSLTPVEELEAMSDQELRDYCDELAEVIVPPGVSWLPWLAIGGVAVLGIGAASLALKKRRR